MVTSTTADRRFVAEMEALERPVIKSVLMGSSNFLKAGSYFHCFVLVSFAQGGSGE